MQHKALIRLFSFFSPFPGGTQLFLNLISIHNLPPSEATKGESKFRGTPPRPRQGTSSPAPLFMSAFQHLYIDKGRCTRKSISRIFPDVVYSSLCGNGTFGLETDLFFLYGRASRTRPERGLTGTDHFVQVPAKVFEQHHCGVSTRGAGDRTTWMGGSPGLVKARNRHAVLGEAWNRT